MPTELKPEQVRKDAFTENLGSDFVAVDANGRVLARADTEEAARLAVPGAAAFFTGKDFGGNAAASKTQPTPDIGASPLNPPPGIPTTPGGLPISDALADDPTPEPKTRTHPLDDGTPFEGPQAIDPTSKALNRIAAEATSGEPIKDALKASHAADVKAENAGRHAKPDELQAEQVKVLEKEVPEAFDEPTTPPARDPDRPARKNDPLDHDGDSRKGGSKKGEESTASKGKAARQHKPDAKK
jgi:hypothetical protein